VSAGQLTYEASVDKPELYGMVPAGTHKVEYQLWVPEGAGTLRYALVIFPSDLGDSRGEARKPEWQEFAKEQRCAILTCKVSKKKDGGALYEKAENWFGKATLETLRELAMASQQPELADAPLLLWGDGEAAADTSYSVANWRPSRVAAFVANRLGGKATSAPRDSMLRVPGLIAGEEKDRERMRGIYNAGQEHGAHWCFAIVAQPEVGGEKVNRVEITIAGKDYSLEPERQFNAKRTFLLGTAFLRGVMGYREILAADKLDCSWLGDLTDGAIRAKEPNAIGRPIDHMAAQPGFCQDLAGVCDGERMTVKSTKVNS
jgi:hypothetical protein